MMYSLKTKLSLTIALVVLLTVVSISLLANTMIENQFKGYIIKQQEKTTQEIVERISMQYDNNANAWDVDFIHNIGMNALHDGYIVKVYDVKDEIVWDAESCDMSQCIDVMDTITHRMMTEYPNMDGEFSSKTFQARNANGIVGTVNISYFGPYFLNEDDFQFLNALNKALIGIGFFSVLISLIVGFFIAKHLSSPILKTVKATKQISNGDYSVRIQEETSTKEVDELIGSINHLAGALEIQEGLRRQLTADVAHELRTPLTTVQTHLEALIEGVWQPTTERLQSCYDEMTRINTLVSDLEKLAKIESDNLKLNKTKINLLEISNSIIDKFEPEFKKKGLRAFVSGNCADILADKGRIEQVYMNLLSNAVKFTPEGSEINISISEMHDSVTFSVKDNGIGIAADEIPFIFERFYRADKSRNRMTGGSGIGLAIVKSIVTAHEGTVDVESHLDKGSSFTVTLPKGLEMSNAV
jgi:two-component system, OmpR family, sensor histidine kinase BaeS